MQIKSLTLQLHVFKNRTFGFLFLGRLDFCDVTMYCIFVKSSIAHERLSSTWEINVVRMELFYLYRFSSISTFAAVNFQCR